ncbi:MAG TPA: VTT domain-containing protein [Xanthomonadaceae bacterium]|nr:VTT domain-containing protein [Xanthomonadaceae bacterium]
MHGAWFDSTIAWIGAHPVAAGGVVLLIAFCDALIVLGIVVPALPLLFAVGALVGLGHVDGGYAIACAAAGAFAGDLLSYWIGRRWGPQLRDRWPFARYPQWIDRGERLFRRNSLSAILIARFVGAVRPFVPAIAGMLHMPLRRYLPISLFAAVLWAAIFLAPGWALGASYEAVAGVADRLALVLGALVLVLGLAWAVVVYTYRWFDAHANALLVQALRWSRAHPRLGRYARALIDPNRPESASLAILAACLLIIGWAWFGLLALVLVNGGPLAIDRSVFETMSGLRNPLADRLMAGLASIGDPQVLAPAAALALFWLLWRRRWMAAAHWLAALAFGLTLTAWLDASIDMPRPAGAASGFGFPSIAVTMTTITFGFFAVLIARELPGRTRIWPYLISAVVVALLGFARLYLGAHWLSDVLGGILFGIAWLLLLGIAYRRHVARTFWMRPLAAVFYGAFVVAGLLHAPDAGARLLQRFKPAPPQRSLTADAWWREDWKTLPDARNERRAAHRWPLNVQVLGDPTALQRSLQRSGWRAQAQAGWPAALGLLDTDKPDAGQPILPATLGGHAEALLLVRPTSRPGERHVLRLWPAPARIADGRALWIGTAETMRFVRPVKGFGLWLPQPDHGAARDRLRGDIEGFALAQAPHPHGGGPVLRIRTD